MGHYYNGDVRLLLKVAQNLCNYYINYCCQCSDHVNAIIAMLSINIIIVHICCTLESTNQRTSLPHSPADSVHRLVEHIGGTY